jgi:hypothetical protein
VIGWKLLVSLLAFAVVGLALFGFIFSFLQIK